MRNRYGFEPRPRTVAELLRWPALFCLGLGVVSGFGDWRDYLVWPAFLIELWVAFTERDK